MLDTLPERDEAAASAVRERAAHVLRPPGALQRLDRIAEHVAGWRATDRPAVDSPRVLVFAADHGVAAAGVSAYPAEITASMLAAVRAGTASINAMARSVGATVVASDVGVGDPTGDIRVEAAMDPGRFDRVVATAVSTVDDIADDGADLLVLGELGIGNTTVAAALTAALLGVAPADAVGRGTGVDDAGLARKLDAVTAAVDRIADRGDPIDVLREIGGAEHVAMAAACARARQRRVPVVVDGYVATSAMLPLHCARPGALDHCLAGHVSAEPGHRLVVERLGLEPILDLGMRLGEGSGAVAAVPIIAAACAAVVEVATFDEWFGGGA